MSLCILQPGRLLCPHGSFSRQALPDQMPQTAVMEKEIVAMGLKLSSMIGHQLELEQYLKK
jgi:hypothetical protein